MKTTSIGPRWFKLRLRPTRKPRMNTCPCPHEAHAPGHYMNACPRRREEAWVNLAEGNEAKAPPQLDDLEIEGNEALFDREELPPEEGECLVVRWVRIVCVRMTKNGAEEMFVFP